MTIITNIKDISIPQCKECITLAVCKGQLSQVRNYDEAMMAVDELAKRCSLANDYVMDLIEHVTQSPMNNQDTFKYITLNESRAAELFELIIPRKTPKKETINDAKYIHKYAKPVPM